MPRVPRYIVPGFAYHLISRFVDRDWFIKRDGERRLYLSLIAAALALTDWRCIAYAVMSNHIHLGVIAGKQLLASWSRRVNSPFASFMNRHYDRIGPMFVRGPRAYETDPDDVARLVAYIHNNPVRAGVVANAADSTWSSHRAYVGIAPPPPWLDVDAGLARCGFDDHRTFDAFVALNPSDPAREALERNPDVIEPTARFREAIERPKRGVVRPSAAAIVEATADELGMPVMRLCSPLRGVAEVRGREVAVRCANEYGVTGVEIAAALALSQSAASRVLGRIAGDVDVARLSSNVMCRLRNAAASS